MRITKKMIIGKCNRVFNMLHLPTEATWDNEKGKYNHDFYVVDYAPIYGGYAIVLKYTDTSESNITSVRMSAKEFYQYLEGMETGIRLTKEV